MGIESDCLVQIQNSGNVEKTPPLLRFGQWGHLARFLQREQTCCTRKQSLSVVKQLECNHKEYIQNLAGTEYIYTNI